MTITAKYIGQSSVQITTAYEAAAGLATLTSFATIANTIADAIIGTQPGSAGATKTGTNSGNASTSDAKNSYSTLDSEAVTFTADSGVTAQASTNWVLFDSFWGGDVSVQPSSVANHRSLIFTQVFRSLNKDNATYKWFIIRYNAQTRLLNTSSCESWNGTTRQPTNEVCTFNDCSPIPFSAVAMDMIIMVSSRWVFITSYIDADPCGWSGVIELDREDPYDTGAYPCHVWLCNYSMLAGIRRDDSMLPEAETPTSSPWNYEIYSKPGNNSYQQIGSMPRTADGSTGKSALLKVWAFDMGYGSHPTYNNEPCNSIIQFIDSGAYRVSLANQTGNVANDGMFVKNSWNSAIVQALPFKPILNINHPYPKNYGQAYGLKMVPKAGKQMDRVTIAVDSDGNSSKTGTNRQHWLLNNQYPMVTGNSYDMLLGNINSGAGFPVSKLLADVCTPGARITFVTWLDTYAYLTDTADRLYRVDTRTGVTVEITAPNMTSYPINDMKFDGERYIYILSSDFIWRVDIANDSILAKAIPGISNAACLGLNSKGLFVGTKSQTTNNVYSLRYLPKNADLSNNWSSVAVQANSSWRDSDPSYVVNIEASPEGNFWVIPTSGQWTSSPSYSTLNYISHYNDETNAAAIAFSGSYWYSEQHSGHASGVIQIDKDFVIPLSPVKNRASGQIRYTPAVYAYKSGQNPNNYLTYGGKGSPYFGDNVGNNGVFSDGSYEAVVKNDVRTYRGYGFKIGGCLIMTAVPGSSTTTIYWSSLNLLGMRYDPWSPVALDTSSSGGGSGTTGWFELNGYPILKSNGVGLLAACGSRMKVVRGYGYQGRVGGAWPSNSTAAGQFAVPM
jgi:hypothetical protein